MNNVVVEIKKIKASAAFFKVSIRLSEVIYRKLKLALGVGSLGGHGLAFPFRGSVQTAGG